MYAVCCLIFKSLLSSNGASFHRYWMHYLFDKMDKLYADKKSWGLGQVTGYS